MTAKIKQVPVGIGQNLKRLRQKAGYSQSRFAELLRLEGLPVSNDIYKKMEQNRYSIRVNELMAMKEIFNVDYDEFFKDLAAEKTHTAK